MDKTKDLNSLGSKYINYENKYVNDENKYFVCTKMRATLLMSACDYYRGQADKKRRIVDRELSKIPGQCYECGGWAVIGKEFISREEFERSSYEGLEKFSTAQHEEIELTKQIIRRNRDF